MTRARKLTLAAFFLAWVSFQLFLSAGVFSFDYDEGVYLQTAFQYARGQKLYSGVFLDQPPLFVESLRLLITLFGNGVFAARACVTFFGLAVLVAVLLIARDLFGERAAFLAVLFTGVNFYLFADARTVHGNTPSLAFALFSVFAAVRYNETRRFEWVPLSAILFALANGFKLLEMFFVFPIMLLFTVDIRQEPAKAVFFPAGRILAACVVFALVFFAVFVPILAVYRLSTAFRFIFLMGAKGAFRITRNVQMFFSAYVGYQPGLAAAVIAGFANLWVLRRRVFTLFAVWTLAQLVFHALMSEWLWHHHLIALFPVFAITAAAGIDMFVRSFEGNRGVLFGRLGRTPAILRAVLSVGFAFIAIPNLIGTVYIYTKYAARTASAPVEALMAAIEANSASGDIIVSDEPMALYRSGRLTFPDLVETSRRRINTGNLTEARLLELRDEPKMVIFWNKRLNGFQAYYMYVRERYTLVYKEKHMEIYARP